MTITLKKPPIVATVFLLLGISILCTLGAWQYKRLLWKEDLLAKINVELAKNPSHHTINFEDVNKAVKYARGHIVGKYLHDKTVLIQPRVHESIPGYHVFTPFLPDGFDRAVLVNRGWIPIKNERDEDYELSEPSGTVLIEGMIIQNEEPNSFVPENQPAKDSWYRIDIAQIAAEKDQPLLTTHFFQIESVNDAEYPIAQDATVNISNNHAQYMLFWFAMAMALFAVFCLRFVVCFEKPVCG